MADQFKTLFVISKQADLKGEIMEEVKEEVSNLETTEEARVASNTSISDRSCNIAVPRLGFVRGRTTGPTRRSTRGGWTKEEIDFLIFAAELFTSRTDVQCLHRWQKVLDPNLIKGPWTKEEDDHITELVERYGSNKWSDIAKSLSGRIGKQCRERWHNHLNPAIKKDAWTEEEEQVLIHAHQTYGNKWAEIAKFLPGRADNSIKNHWNCSMKKRLNSFPACGSATDLPGPITPDFYKYETKEESVKTEVVRQSRGTIVSLDQKMDSGMDGNFDTCSLDLVLGNYGGDIHKQSQPFKVENCRSPKETVNYQMKSPSGTQCDDRDATANGLSSKQCRDNAKNGNSHCIIAVHPKSSYGTSLGDAVKSSRSHKRTHEPANLINFSSPRPPSVHVSLDVSGCTIKLSYPLEVVFPVTAENNQVNCSTPPSHVRGMSGNGNSPESLLRSAAKSFRNTPSIIRKRGCRTPRQAGNANYSDGACTPEGQTGNSNDKLCLAHSPPHGKNDINSTDLNVKRLFLSSPNSQKRKTSAAVKSVEKCLEFEFDMERDSAKAKYCVSATASDSLDATVAQI
ncbi:hypothetical protein HHK36_001102 [Tetracentron sinense]|uniref:Uncharacterized protein n=1 Tax=Tetracentron sinense TaxID=13715 RepID=A0A834ZTE1_TETSI|nr:hypothetical protein HHK36_001102 [Tetracentron sinense]